MTLLLNRPAVFPAVRGVVAIALVSALLGGCASTSGDGRPVLYPNAALNRVGEAQGRAEISACMDKAQAAGLSPREGNNQVAQRAGEGAATAGLAALVGSLVFNRSMDGALRAGAAGAAVGGSAGAVQGSFRGDKPSGLYRTFVQRCLAEKGFDVIGWN